MAMRNTALRSLRFVCRTSVFCLSLLLSISFVTVLNTSESQALGDGPLVSGPDEFGISLPVSNLGSEVMSNPLLRNIETKAYNHAHKRPSLPARSLREEKTDPAIQSSSPTRAIPDPELTFEGQGNIDNFLISGVLPTPPDTNGDVGPDNYVQMVNNLFTIYDKSGTALTPPLLLSTLFASGGVSGPCGTEDFGDPIVLYDHLADRWILTQFAFETNGMGGLVPPFFECIAVSQTGDPLGSYAVYTYEMPMDVFNDFPKFGVWPDGYYMGANTDSQVGGPSVFAYNRSKMLLGDGTAEMIAFLGPVQESTSDFCFYLMPADLDGPAPPGGTPNFFTCVQSDEFPPVPADAIGVFAFHADFGTPASSTFTKVGSVLTAPFDIDLCDFGNDLDCIPQPDTAEKLDGLALFFSNRVQFRDFGTFQTLVVTFAVDAGDFPDHAAFRYEVVRRNLDGTFTIPEQATYAPDANHRWIASAALDRAGNLAVGYSVSSGSVFPSIRYAGRLAADPPNGLTQGESTLFPGGGSQEGSNRWGDYSALMVDPSDGCTFWYTNEYYTELNTLDVLWSTRIGKFVFPECFAGADVFIEKTSGTKSVKKNQEAEIHYTITIRNDSGIALSDVAVLDNLPDGSSLVDATPGCIESVPGSVLCEVGDLEADGERNFEVTMTITPVTDADIVNEAIVNFLGGQNSDTYVVKIKSGSGGGGCAIAGSPEAGTAGAALLILLTPLFAAGARIFRRRLTGSTMQDS